MNIAAIQKLVRIFCAISFVGIGISHFTHADLFVGIMPTYLPWHRELVWLSGFFEVLGGLGLLVPTWRRFSAWGLLALLVAVFPANIHMAMNEVYLNVDWLPQSRIGLYVRLPMQLVIALEVWFVGLWEPASQPPSRD